MTRMTEMKEMIRMTEITQMTEGINNRNDIEDRCDRNYKHFKDNYKIILNSTITLDSNPNVELEPLKHISMTLNDILLCLFVCFYICMNESCLFIEILSILRVYVGNSFIRCGVINICIECVVLQKANRAYRRSLSFL